MGLNNKTSSQIETPYIAVQRRNRNWLTRFAYSVGLPLTLFLLFFYGYCWGLWGRGSLLLQHLFQCSCPVASEEARYPDDVDVIVPACRYGGVWLSPSGRLLYVREIDDEAISTYLLDLHTQEKTPFFIPEGSHYFLTDDLVFQWVDCGKGHECGYFILDLKTGKQYPLPKLKNSNLWPDAYDFGKVDIGALANYLKGAKDVFLIDTRGGEVIVALNSDFRIVPERNFFVSNPLKSYDSDSEEAFLRNNNINYHFVPAMFPGEVISPDGRFIARSDGIYLAATDQKIVEEYSSNKYYRWYRRGFFSVRGWTYDGTGVIYSTFLTPCLVEVPILDEIGCFKSVPQPLIKLKVPEEYLSPAKTP